jgi:hypothetical protein
VCGKNGVINNYIYQNPNIPPYDYCVCLGLWYTNVTLFTSLSGKGEWCSLSKCQNGGKPNSMNPSMCACPIPYLPIQKPGQAFCTVNTCQWQSGQSSEYPWARKSNFHGTPQSGVGCVCDISLNGLAWTDQNCTTNPCVHGVWTTKACKCDIG